MQCPQCGKDTEGPLFCEYCGASLEIAPALEQQLKQGPNFPPWVWGVIGLTIACLIVIFILSIVAFLVLRSDKESATVPPAQILTATIIPTDIPDHPDWFSAIIVDQYLVTNAQYIDYLNQTNPAYLEQLGEKRLNELNSLGDEPAGWPTWTEAQAYCNWQGGRIPTERELRHFGPALNADGDWEWTFDCDEDMCYNIDTMGYGERGYLEKNKSYDLVFFRCMRMRR
jgi:hypothetical protein